MSSRFAEYMCKMEAAAAEPDAHPDALFELAYWLDNGFCVAKRDTPRAAALYERAHAAGHKVAAAMLACESDKWAEIVVADAGNAYAQSIYHFGRFGYAVEPQHEEEWQRHFTALLHAANGSGGAFAQQELCLVSDGATGLEGGMFIYAIQAATAGWPVAQHLLGRVFAQRNQHDRAAKCFYAAGCQGLPEARLEAAYYMLYSDDEKTRRMGAAWFVGAVPIYMVDFGVQPELLYARLHWHKEHRMAVPAWVLHERYLLGRMFHLQERTRVPSFHDDIETFRNSVYLASRRAAGDAARALLTALYYARRVIPRDLSVMIARMVWETRVEPAEWILTN